MYFNGTGIWGGETLPPQIQDGDHDVRKSLTCHNHHVFETFFFRAMDSTKIYFHHRNFSYSVPINTKSNMAAILVNSFNAGAAIKRCPTASSYMGI